MDREASIGVFDSGLGGLTVVRAIMECLPGESVVYLGDTARVPYGTRSAQTVIQYARGCARRLCQHEVKQLVVACNTASAVALDVLRVELDIPVLGVIEPGARAGVAASCSGRIGVIGTAGTVASGAYARAVAGLDPRAEVFAREAPLLVPLAEEGWTEGEVPAAVVRRYLEPLVHAGIDCLVLGCTHYPLLRPVLEAQIRALFGRQLPVVDSAQATAEELRRVLDQRDLRVRNRDTCSLCLLVTDMPERFMDVASGFLGRSLEGMDVRQIDL